VSARPWTRNRVNAPEPLLDLFADQAIVDGRTSRQLA
jgi:hypothetical protein